MRKRTCTDILSLYVEHSYVRYNTICLYYAVTVIMYLYSILSYNLTKEMIGRYTGNEKHPFNISLGLSHY